MYTTIDEIEEIVRSFETHTLARSEWTHQAHLTVALWYLVYYSPLEAETRLREGIQQYNAANGIQTTPTGGYHETITLFWIRRVQKFLSHNLVDHLTFETVNTLMQECGDPKLPFAYYSHDRLMSWEARTIWIEPDLQPLHD